MRPPMVGADLWTAVVERAGGTCCCTGACGRDHWATGLHCTEQDKPRRRLLVAPAVPMSAQQAMRVPAAELTAWCPGCWNRAQRLATTRRTALVDQMALFDPDPAPTLTTCECRPPQTLPCGHCAHCDRCLDCARCAGSGCTCACEEETDR